MRTYFALTVFFIAMNSSAAESAPETAVELTKTEQVNSPDAPPAEDTPEQPPARKFKVAVGLIAVSERKIKFDKGRGSTGGAYSDFQGEFTFGSAGGVFAEIQHMPEDNVGFQAGAEIIAQAEVKSVKLTDSTGSITLTPTGTPAKLGFLNLYGNGLYRWKIPYVLLGLTLSSPGAEWNNTTVKGGIGAQIGVGFQFSPLFSLEIQSQSTSINIRTTASPIDLNYGDGYATSGRLLGKFSF